MAQSLDQTIINLKNLILDKNCRKMNLSTVKGYYGELLVKQKFEEEGCQVGQLGNQSGYDLDVSSNNRSFKIDVKLSTLKDEHNWGTYYWGWALHHSNKKSERLTATHLICVACRVDLTPECFFVIRAADVPRFPAGVGQFSKVKHGFRVSQDPNAQITDQTWRSTFEQSGELVRNGFAVKVERHKRLIETILKLL